MLYDKKAVLDFLPHRDPFLFIDSVESITLAPESSHIKQVDLEKKDIVGSTVIAHYRTKQDHPIFKGHFPGNPILPGVVQIEMMAQASIFMIKLLKPENDEKKLKVALLSVTNSKFRMPILPEMDIVLKTTCSRIRGSIITTDCKAFYNDKLVSEVSTLASIDF